MAKKSAKPVASDAAEKPKRSRRGKGEGSICQRSDGLWMARIDVGCDATGKRKRRCVYGKTKKAVADELTKLANEKLDGTLVSDTQITVEQFMTTWLDTSAKLKVRASTLASYKQVNRLHVVPAIGSRKLAKLSPTQVQKMLSDMTDAGSSQRLVQMAYALIRQALAKAVKWGIVARNVALAVDRTASDGGNSHVGTQGTHDDRGTGRLLVGVS